MGIIASKLILERGLRTAFLKAYDNGEDPADIMPFVMETTSNAADEKYGWLGAVPQLTEWIDRRTLKGLRDFNFTITNRDYEATLQVHKNTLEDDQLGAVLLRVNDLANKARTHVRKLFFDKLLSGTVDLAYDGLPFFSASHTEGDSGTQSNLNGSGSGTTVAQLKTDFIAARSAMRSYKDDQGEPLNEDEMDLSVVIPPDLEGAFDELLIANEISSTTNTLRGAAKKVVSSRLTDVNDWYLISQSGTVKPFVRQIRQAVEFRQLKEDSDEGFHSKLFQFGVDYRVGFDYGLWQRAFKVVNT